jgi:hypothetical protein
VNGSNLARCTEPRAPCKGPLFQQVEALGANLTKANTAT